MNQLRSVLEEAHASSLDELKGQAPEEQNRRIHDVCKQLVQSGQFAVLEVLGERLKIDIFNTMMQTREEAELHESRGSAKGIEDLLSTVFAEASFDRE